MASVIASNHNLIGLDLPELEQFVLEAGQPRYRAVQLYRAIYARREWDFSVLTDLDKNFRAYLSTHCAIRYPEMRQEFASRDGSIRYILGLEDGNTIEAVYMPETRRTTFCISSQVGCAVDCRFCFTGLLGVKRNLTAGGEGGPVPAGGRGPSPSQRTKLPPRPDGGFLVTGETPPELLTSVYSGQSLAAPAPRCTPLRP